MIGRLAAATMATAFIAGASHAAPPERAPACPFTYTPTIRDDVVRPEVNRLTEGHAANFRVEDPDIHVEDNGNIHLQMLWRGSDGDTIVVVINPCTGKIVSSADFPANPEYVPCPPQAPPGAWCIKPDDPKN